VDDHTVLAIAARVTEDLLPGEPDPASSATTQDEARLVVAEMLEQVGGLGPVDPDRILPDAAAGADTGRLLLGLMLDDPAVAPAVQELVDSPPEDEQMVVELAIGSAILLGLLVTWLRTKVSLHIERRDGKTSITFDLTKEASTADEVKTVVKAVAGVLGIRVG
jgi:hypothetical protein